MKRRPWYRRLFLNLVLMAVAAAFAFLVGEVLIRIVAPQQLIIPRPDIYVAADSVGWKHAASVSTTVNTGEREVDFITDSSGFRIGKSGRRDTPRRVLMIGDSFMAAMQVEYEQSVAGLLDTALAKAEPPASVVNTAVSAWDPPQYLIQLRRSLDSARYDAVVSFIYVGNDVVRRVPRSIGRFVPEEVHSFRFPRRLSLGELIDAWLYPINDGLERHSHLFIFLKRGLRTILMPLGLTAVTPPIEVLRSEASSGRWDTTAAAIKEMVDIATKRDVPILFVLLPSSYQVDSVELRQYIRGFSMDSTEIDVDQPSRLLGDRLAAASVDFVDGFPALQAAARGTEPMFGSVDRHLSPAGHRTIAALVLPRLLNRLSSQQKDRKPPRGPGRGDAGVGARGADHN